MLKWGAGTDLLIGGMVMDLCITGRHIVIMGGTHGLGEAVAQAALEEGARVTVTSRQDQPSKRFAVKVLDTADDKSIAQFVHNWGEQSLDALFVNTGGPKPGAVKDLSLQDWDYAWRQVVRGPLAVVRALIPYMVSGGAIVFNTSSSIRSPIPNLALSNVLRPAVSALAKSLADELAPHQIRVNVIAPGRIATRRVEELDKASANRLGQSEKWIKEQAVSKIPLGRYGDPQEFGRAAVFLLSPAAGFVTGTTLLVDGGQTRVL